MSATLRTLHAALGGVLHGAADRVVHRIAPLAEATEDALAFVAHPRYRAVVAHSRAGVILAPPDLVADVMARPDPPEFGWACWESPDPYLTFAYLTQWWRRHVQPRPESSGVHPTAYVAPDAEVHPSACVGPMAVVESGAVVRAEAHIGAHAVVQARASVGEGTRLGPGVVLGYDCRIGARGIVHGLSLIHI